MGQLSRRARPLLGTISGQSVKPRPTLKQYTEENRDDSPESSSSSESGGDAAIEAEAGLQDIDLPDEESKNEKEKENARERAMAENKRRSQIRAPKKPRGVLTEGQGRPAPSSSQGSSDSGGSRKRKRDTPAMNLSDSKDGAPEPAFSTQEPPGATQEEDMHVMSASQRIPPKITYNGFNNFHATKSSQQPRSSLGSQGMAGL